jgi:hypothetical protein
MKNTNRALVSQAAATRTRRLAVGGRLLTLVLRALRVALLPASDTRLLSPSTQAELARSLECVGSNVAALAALPETIRQQVRLDSSAIFGGAFTMPATLERTAWVQAWYDARAKAG